jgi:hypothetical protein
MCAAEQFEVEHSKQRPPAAQKSMLGVTCLPKNSFGQPTQGGAEKYANARACPNRLGTPEAMSC